MKLHHVVRWIRLRLFEIIITVSLGTPKRNTSHSRTHREDTDVRPKGINYINSLDIHLENGAVVIEGLNEKKENREFRTTIK